MNDAFSSTLNSSGINSIPGNGDLNSSQASQQQHQQIQSQHYSMLQQNPNLEEQVIGQQLQQLVKLQNQHQIGSAATLQIQQQVSKRVDLHCGTMFFETC